MRQNPLAAYLPLDRRQALAVGRSLPDRSSGCALLADLSGFTPLADALSAAHGPRRGVEELTALLNRVYSPLIERVHRYRGSVVSFIGDALLCWFDQDDGRRGVAAALAMQRAMASLAAPGTPADDALSLSLKTGLAAGPTRRFLVGRPSLDLLAGATLERMARAEQIAEAGEVILDPATAQALASQIEIVGRRQGFALVGGMALEVPPAPWPQLDLGALEAGKLRPFLLAPVYERLVAGQGEFLAELRPAVALFLRFAGLDYEADEAGPQLDTLVRRAQGVLQHYEGHLLQLTVGDKGSFFYATFGTLSAHEDDAGRALAAAQELQQLPRELEFIQGVQIGLSRGRVRAGAYGSAARRSYGAVGPEVVVACRLMENAPAGEVWCSPAVHKAARAQWVLEPLEPIVLKGKIDPLPVFRPLRRQRGRAVRPLGSLVGRQDELATLKRLLDEAAAGQRRVLLLEGEPGIGKSRLLAELRDLARQEGLRWLEGAGQSIEQGTPYRAWRDLLAAYFGLEPHMGSAERRQCVQEGVVAVNPALAPRAPLLNDVLQLGLPETALTQSLEPKLRHESLTALLLDLLRARAGQGPLALVLEDAHWLDSLSWQLALSVARALYEQPLLLVMALRPLPEELPEGAALANLAGAETLPLQALTAENATALAAARLGVDSQALPEEVAALVQQRAGGNPLFAEELAHVLRESGVLAVERGRCVLVGDLAALRAAVPDTVEGVVLARIDRLPPEQQLTLKVAAVIGRVFLYRTLRDVHPRRVLEEILRAQLGELDRRDLTLVEALEPELCYLFKHVITREVAYETLLFAQRRELHRVVAGWYERVYAGALEPYLPLLVHHYHQAEEREKERHYARLAGEQAAGQYANAEALRYLGRALELTPQDDLLERYDLLLALEAIHNLQGERKAQHRDLRALQELANALDCDKRRGEVLLRQSHYSEVTSEYPSAIAAAKEAIRWGKVVRDKHLEAKGYRQWGRVLWHQGKLDTACLQLERALELAREGSLPLVEADTLLDLGVVFGLQGDYAKSRNCHEQSLVICRKRGNRHGEARALASLALGFLYESAYEESQNYYEQSLHTAREIGSRLIEAQAIASMAIICDLLGDYSQSIAYNKQALHIYREIANLLRQASVLHCLGIVYTNQGEHIKARTHFEQALQIQRSVGDRRCEGTTLGCLGIVSRELGHYAQALDYIEQSLRIAREVGDRRGEAECLGDTSLILHYMAEHQRALEYAKQALAIVQDIGDRSSEGYTLTFLGQAQLGLGRLDEAAKLYQQSLDLRRELGEHHLATESLAGLAQVRLAQGDLERARCHTEEILHYLDGASLQGTEQTVRICLACYQVLRASSDSRAPEILHAAYRLLQEQAARIDDEELRCSFLHNVAAHRAILEAFDGVVHGPRTMTP
ncbi:MAG: tetratricopeptide repeat protein [Chloroflexia bacterium]|nr:tetratricopeptide repeat protein [Chloroflexia bacterium]